MRNSNIVKVDPKGRILIPIHIRKFLNVDDGTEIIIIPDNEKAQARILPLIKEKTAEIRFLISDIPGSLATIASILSKNHVNIIMSESRTVLKKKVAEWDVIIDTSESETSLDELKNELSHYNIIKSVEVIKK